MSGTWQRSHGLPIEAPPDERGGNSRGRPTTTAPHLDSTAASTTKYLGLPRVADSTETEIRKMLAKGTGKLKIARTLKVGVSTVQRVAAS